MGDNNEVGVWQGDCLDIGMTQTTVRIARKVRTEQGAIIKTEVLGEWFVSPDQYPRSDRMSYIRKTLAEARQEEPNLGWTLESRGSHFSWHPINDDVA